MINSKLYGVVVADPPWPNTPTGIKSAGSKVILEGWWADHRRMTIQELCQMEIPASQDSILFLWSTNGEMANAIKVMKEWGFIYKSVSVWAKTRKNGDLMAPFFGMGMWVASAHEIILVGIKGKPKRALGKPVLPGIWGSPPVKGGGGGKPELLQEYIEKAELEGPYLEMFARRIRPGWDIYGELEGSIRIGNKQ